MHHSLAVPRPWLQALLLVALAIGAYWPSRDNGFFFDDALRIVENPGIRRLTPLSRFLTEPRLSASEKRLANYRPLLAMSLALDHARGGLDPGPYRTTQLLTHAAATLATWGCLGALLGPVAPGAAFWAAALVATHPVGGVAVRYLSARDLLQMQLFLMASLGLYLWWRRSRGGLTPWTWAGVLGLFALSLLSKKNGVVLPALVLWIEAVLPDTSGQPPGWRTGLRRALVFAVPVVLVAGAGRFFLGYDEMPMVLDPAEPLSPSYLATQLWVHWRVYALGFLAPWTLQLEPAVPRLGLADPRAWVGGLAVAATLALAARHRRSHPVAATCVVAYWLLLVPTSSFLNLYALAVPYRPYPSSAFLFAGLMLLLAHVPRGTRIAGGLVTASLVAALATDAAWQDAEAVWAHSLAGGTTPRAEASLAIQEPDPVRRAARLEEMVRSRPSHVLASLVLAETWLRLGRRDEALDVIRRVRTQVPDQERYQELAGKLLLAAGEVDEALDAARVAQALDPESIPVRLLLAKALQLAGDPEASLPHLEFVARAAPGFEDVDLRRGWVAESRQDLPAAEALYRQHLAGHPDDPVGARYLGSALFRLGRFEEAVRWLEAARAGGQGSRQVDQELWAAYRQLGKSSSAAAALARLRRSPGL